MGPWFATRAEYFSGGPSSVISLETSDIVMAGVVRAQTFIDWTTRQTGLWLWGTHQQGPPVKDGELYLDQASTPLLPLSPDHPAHCPA